MEKFKIIIIVLAAVAVVAATAITVLYFNPKTELCFMETTNGGVYRKLPSGTCTPYFGLPLPLSKAEQMLDYTTRGGELAAMLIGDYTGAGTYISCAASVADGKTTLTYTGVGVRADGTSEQVNETIVFNFVFDIIEN